MSNHYRHKCLSAKGKECHICGDDKCIEVHHIDGNKENNRLDNLIPLCPTCHRCVHKGKEGYEKWNNKLNKRGGGYIATILDDGETKKVPLKDYVIPLDEDEEMIVPSQVAYAETKLVKDGKVDVSRGLDDGDVVKIMAVMCEPSDQTSVEGNAEQNTKMAQN